MNKEEKKERKELVKETRKEFKKDPAKFAKENWINPLKKAWKEQFWYCLYTFFKWVIITGLIFGSIQAINNDMIYCDSSIDEFDGKIMYTHNAFVAHYNEKARNMELEQIPKDYQVREGKVNTFNDKYTMFCDYNLSRWNNEPIKDRFNTTLFGFKKIILKQS